MFTGLKNQLELSDSLIENILPQDNELVKLKKILTALKNDFFIFITK